MLSRLALISAAFAISLPLPIRAHDIYSHLKDGEGKSCCDERDCQPAHYRLSQRGVKMLVDRRWIDVPSEKIQYLSLPGDDGATGGGHWCGAAYEPSGADISTAYVTRCAILPPQSASAQIDPPLSLQDRNVAVCAK
jgi:hypothetical protein